MTNQQEALFLNGSPEDGPTRDQARALLQNGSAEFDAKFPHECADDCRCKDPSFLERSIDQLLANANLPKCDHCGATFNPRRGGKPQRFCTAACKDGWHAEQRSKRDTLQNPLPAVVPQPKSKNAPVTLVADQEAITFEQDDLGISLRQRCSMGGDDRWVWIASENVDAFIDQLTDLLGYGGAPLK